MGRDAGHAGGPATAAPRSPLRRALALPQRVAARRRRDPGADFDAVASVTERIAALLTAGVPASALWTHLEADAAGDAVVAAAQRAAVAGEPVDAAIGAAAAATTASAAWAQLAAAWHVAEATGAPMAACLRDLATAMRAEAQLRREFGAALAGPAASARLVTLLPLISIGFGLLFGFDTIGVLVGNPIGVACLVAGSLLLWAGARWNRALLSRASRASAAPGLDLELTAIAMSGGASIERATAAVETGLASHLPWAQSGRAADVLALAARAGAPVAALLRAEAARIRGAERVAGASRAAALGVRLMIPLGVCVLPAFVLLGVAPLMLSVVSGTLGVAS